MSIIRRAIIVDSDSESVSSSSSNLGSQSTYAASPPSTITNHHLQSTVPDPSSSSEEDEPIIHRSPSSHSRSVKRNQVVSEEYYSEDEPITHRSPNTLSTTLKRSQVISEEDNSEDVPIRKRRRSSAAKVRSESDSEDEPISKRRRSSTSTKPPPATKRKSISSSTTSKKKKTSTSSKQSTCPYPDSNVKQSPRASSPKKKPDKQIKKPVKSQILSTSSKKVKNSKTVKSEDEQDDESSNEFKWWQDSESMNDTSIKWTSLSHNGVLFPPEYVPHRIPIKYNGSKIQLGPAAEEMATFYAGIIGTQHEQNEIFKENFFNDFLALIRNTEPKLTMIKYLNNCDFSEIVDHLTSEKERKKLMTKEEKNLMKQEKAKIDEKYGWALIDGRKEKIGNFRIEPPGLFRGRGAHPKAGKLKTRIRPEDITINIGPDAKIPPAPAGHRWREVVHDQTATWLATWKENVNNQIKYVFLAATSSWKGMSDLKKFEKARDLKKVASKIRKEYTLMLKDKEMVKRQLATALYFIDQFALRAGNEKSDDEADTVGCCSLRYEHVTLSDSDTVTFDFLGKDSIRYYNQVRVELQVFKNLRIFKKNSKVGDPLFDRIDPTSLNKYLQSLMPGLTAKVFRTYNASYTFQNELLKTPVDGSVNEKVLAYNRANRQVAVLCNHQRTVPKTFDVQMEKMTDKLKQLKYQRRLVRQKMLALDPKLKKTRHDEFVGDESDLDDTWIKAYLEAELVKEAERNQVKLQKLNAVRAENGEDSLTELPTPTVREQSLEALEKKLCSVNTKISACKLSMVDKTENKTTALGTSKLNYLDPRISTSWCLKYNVPIERLFPKTLRDKFKWALDIDKDWQF